MDPQGLGDPVIERMMEHADATGVTVSLLAPGVLAKVADAAAPQPCAAVIEGVPGGLGNLGDAHFVIVIDRIQDPGNLGAVIRVAEACGADAVILTGASADPFGPKAMRGATGSSFRIPVLECADPLDAFAALRERGLVVATTTPHGGEDFARCNWPERIALVLGNEAQGLDEEVASQGDLKIMIPMAPGPESLNLSVAAGILAMAVHRNLGAREGGPQGSTIESMRTTEPR